MVGRGADGADGAGPLVLRPPGAPAAVVALVLVLAVAATSYGPSGLLLLLGPALLVAAVLVLPSLRADEVGLTLAGPLRVHRVPWSAVLDVLQAWFLVVVLADGRRLVCPAVPVVGSVLAFRTWSDGEGSQLFLRDSTRIRPYPGAQRSLAVELVLARRPATTRGREPTAGAVTTSVRWGGAAVLVVAVVAGAVGAVLR